MKLPASNRGYTILEVLIFLAVSGFILVAALITVNGRQEQVQYQQAVREIDADIRSAINDVSNGYFPSTDFSCDNNSGLLVISELNAVAQGSKEDCVFAGKAIVPDLGDNEITYVTIAGLRPPLGQAVDLTSASLTPINNSPDISTVKPNPWGLQIVKMVDDSDNDLAYIAYLSSFGRTAQSGQIDSGDQSIGLYKSTTPLAFPMNFQPVSSSDKVFICLESNSGDRKAVIILGEDGRQLTTTLDQDAEGRSECEF